MEEQKKYKKYIKYGGTLMKGRIGRMDIKMTKEEAAELREILRKAYEG